MGRSGLRSGVARGRNGCVLLVAEEQRLRDRAHACAGVRYTARMRRLLLVLAVAGCGDRADDRDGVVVGALVRADLPLLRSRPALVAGKYRAMASDLFSFHRGALPIYLADARDAALPVGRSRFALDVPLVVGLGDPHPENVGLLFGADGVPRLEPNDLDGVELVPYLRDLRRLLVGVAVAVDASNVGSPTALSAAQARRREIVAACVEGYRTAILAYAGGAPPEVFADGGGVPNLEDLFKRGKKDFAARDELAGLTVLEGGTRRLLDDTKGEIPDPTEPTQVLRPLPAVALAALPATLAAYRSTLVEPPPPEYFQVLDAKRELGSGVASWPRIRVLVLVRGPTDAPADDVVLELKELADAGTSAAAWPTQHFARVEDRIDFARRTVWSRPDADPRWGTARWLGLPVQVRTESEGHKTLRVARMTGANGTPEALVATARFLGRMLARVHATPTTLALGSERPAAAIGAVLARDPAGFDAEQVDAALAYLALVEADHRRFPALLADLGPTLGVPADPSDTPSPDLRALFVVDPP